MKIRFKCKNKIITVPEETIEEGFLMKRNPEAIKEKSDIFDQIKKTATK